MAADPRTFPREANLNEQLCRGGRKWRGTSWKPKNLARSESLALVSKGWSCDASVQATLLSASAWEELWTEFFGFRDVPLQALPLGFGCFRVRRSTQQKKNLETARHGFLGRFLVRRLTHKIILARDPKQCKNEMQCMCDNSMWALSVWPLYGSTLCVTTLWEQSMCDHSMWALYVWPPYVSTLCVTTLCVTTLCEHSLCDHSMCDHSRWPLYVWPLYVSTLCVTTLCVTTLCEHSMWEHSMCDHSMWALYVGALYMWALFVGALYGSTLGVTTLWEHRMCEHYVCHKNTTTKTPPQKTPPQKHHHTTTRTPPQKTPPHHHKNTTTKNTTTKNTTTPPQKHHHTTTKTPPHHHKNTTTPRQKHHKNTSMCERHVWALYVWARTPKSTKSTTKNEHQFLGRMLQNTEKYENYHEKWTSVLGPDVAEHRKVRELPRKMNISSWAGCCRTPKSRKITTKNEHQFLGRMLQNTEK